MFSAGRNQLSGIEIFPAGKKIYKADLKIGFAA